MEITCPACHTRFSLKSDKLPKGPFRVVCGKCRHPFIADPAAMGGSSHAAAGSPSGAHGVVSVPSQAGGPPRSFDRDSGMAATMIAPPSGAAGAPNRSGVAAPTRPTAPAPAASGLAAAALMTNTPEPGHGPNAPIQPAPRSAPVKTAPELAIAGPAEQAASPPAKAAPPAPAVPSEPAAAAAPAAPPPVPAAAAPAAPPAAAAAAAPVPSPAAAAAAAAPAAPPVAAAAAAAPAPSPAAPAAAPAPPPVASAPAVAPAAPPAAPAPAAAAPPPPPPPAEGPSGQTIQPPPVEDFQENMRLALLCEDRPDLLPILKGALSELGYKAHVPPSPREALSWVYQNKYEVLLLNEGYGKGTLENNEVLTGLNKMQIQVRRHICVGLIGRSLRTMDNMTAYHKSVNFVMGERDMPRAKSVIRTALADNDEFYRVFKETMKALGKT